MAILGVKVDISKPLAAFQNLRREQLPWTIARALTKTAQDGQSAGRRLEGEVFKLRNDWTVRNTKITAATKTQLMATVYTDTANRATNAPDYLLPQQEGAEKIPHNGRMHIAIPTSYLRAITGNGPIPNRYRPRTLLGFTQGGVTAIGPLTIAQKRQRQISRRDGYYYFLVKLHSGALAIMSRAVNDRDAYPLYILVTEANIRRRFRLDSEVVAIAEERFPDNFRTAAIETIANDLLRGSGLRLSL